MAFAVNWSYIDKTTDKKWFDINFHMTKNRAISSLRKTIRHEITHLVDRLNKGFEYDKEFLEEYVSNNKEINDYKSNEFDSILEFISHSEPVFSYDGLQLYMKASENCLNNASKLIYCIKNETCEEKFHKDVNKLLNKINIEDLVQAVPNTMNGCPKEKIGTKATIYTPGRADNKPIPITWQITGRDSNTTYLTPIKGQEKQALAEIIRLKYVHLKYNDQKELRSEDHTFAQDMGDEIYKFHCPEMYKYDQEVINPIKEDMRNKHKNWTLRIQEKRNSQPHTEL